MHQVERLVMNERKTLRAVLLALLCVPASERWVDVVRPFCNRQRR
jgi:hypothetical protein